MADWADERAVKMYRPNYPRVAEVAQALREARAEGFEAAAKCLEEVNDPESAEYVRKHAGEESNGN